MEEKITAWLARDINGNLSLIPDSRAPLKKTKIALIGDMAKNPRYQGAGSSTINPYHLENAYECFTDNKIEVDFQRWLIKPRFNT